MTRFLPRSSEKETHPQNTPEEDGRKWLKYAQENQDTIVPTFVSPATGEVEAGGLSLGVALWHFLHLGPGSPTK